MKNKYENHPSILIYVPTYLFINHNKALDQNIKHLFCSTCSLFSKDIIRSTRTCILKIKKPRFSYLYKTTKILNHSTIL